MGHCLITDCYLQFCIGTYLKLSDSILDLKQKLTGKNLGFFRSKESRFFRLAFRQAGGDVC